MFLTSLNADILACLLLFKKIEPEAESGKYFQICFSPIWGEKWGRSEHAHASYPGLSLRSPGFSPSSSFGRQWLSILDILQIVFITSVV